MFVGRAVWPVLLGLWCMQKDARIVWFKNRGGTPITWSAPNVIFTGISTSDTPALGAWVHAADVDRCAKQRNPQHHRDRDIVHTQDDGLWHCGGAGRRCSACTPVCEHSEGPCTRAVTELLAYLRLLGCLLGMASRMCWPLAPRPTRYTGFGTAASRSPPGPRSPSLRTREV